MRTASIRSLVSAALLAVTLPAAARAALPFVENDYARALATARARHTPIFLEAWAPW